MKSKLFFCILFICFKGIPQTTPDNFTPEKAKTYYEAAKQTFVKVNFKKGPENEFYTALYFFPELKQRKIKVKFHHSKHRMMSCRPTLISVFRKPAHRKYIIRINPRNTSGIPTTKAFTYNAVVGIFGHELSHIADYEKMSTGKLIRFGFSYKKQALKKQIENNVDQITINHGLGWQLYDYMNQVNQLSAEYDSYKKIKAHFYMSPAQILDQLLMK